MSMFISSFLPNGNYLIAADTRICKSFQDKPSVWIGDDCHKIIKFDNNTFMFMSGALDLCKCVADNLKANYHKKSIKNTLMHISRKVVSMCDKKQVEATFEDHGEVMAFLLVETTGHGIKTGLYLSSQHFNPIEYDEMSSNGVIVLGAYIPGCEDGIRGVIQSAKTYQEVVWAYRTAFNSQSREEVGGTLEMYEISPERGLVNTMSYKIMDSPRMSKIVSEAMCGMDMRLHWGKNQFPGGSQFSLNESGPWHDDCTDADEYKRDKQYDNTWGKPYKFKGKDGRPGADGSDASVTFNNVLKALQKAASIQTTFITADEVGSPKIYGGEIYGAKIYAGYAGGVGTGSVISLTEDGIIMSNDLNDTKLEITSENIPGIGAMTALYGGGKGLLLNAQSIMVALFPGTPAARGMEVNPSGTTFAGDVDFSQAKVIGVPVRFGE